MPNNRNSDFDIDIIEKVVRLTTLAEQAKEDRTEMLERITGVEDQLRTLNGRTRKLEDDNGKSKEVWSQVAAMSGPVDELREQVATMREPFQVVSSGIRFFKRWWWRGMLLAVIAMSAGNQAGRVILDYILKQLGVEIGISN